LIYDERFCRMWEFYLAAVELEFLHGSHMVFQMLLSTKRDAVPITRDFMVDFERATWAKTAGLNDAGPTFGCSKLSCAASRTSACLKA
jgi:hypothetical protein